MSSIKNISLFVPHIFPNFDEKYVANVFAIYGEVDHVDFVAKYDRSGKCFNSAYIHFKCWNNKPESQTLQKRILSKKEDVMVYHDEPWFWIVLENKAKKHVAGDRRLQIDLGTDNVISVNNRDIPMPVLKRSEPILFCPDAPLKSYPEAVGHLDTTSNWTDVQRQLVEDIDLAMENNDALFSIKPSGYLDLMMDAETDEIFAQMDAIEDEMAIDNSNLISIDRRYVKEVERENLWLRGEVSQLRASLINLDYMYQVEAAKVRALNVPFVNVIPDSVNL